MRYSMLIISALATTILALPTTQTNTPLQRRAAVLGSSTYDALSISGGTAGNCESEALAKFSALDLNNMAAVDAADIKFLGAVNDIANDAEKEAFNTAIAAATGDEKIALTNGKIKNKCLKLMATKLELQIKAAQGEDTSAKLAAETKKLNNNIALDKKAAGQPSTKLAFSAST